MGKLHSLLHEEVVYSIGIRKRGEKLLMEGDYAPFTIMPISKDIWYADPIVFSHENKDYLFCEVYDRNTDRGSIGVTELNGLYPAPPHIVLDIGTHLSYPCVFEYRGQVFMIPETTTRKNIMLFRAVRFPEQWEFVKELMTGGEYADTTVYAGSNRLIMLTFEQYQGDGSITKVGVHGADEIDKGVIGPFPAEAFTFNARSRGAGLLFTHNKTLVRPAQICRPDYGHALNFMEVSLEGGTYSEKEWCQVYPEDLRYDLKRQVIGIHTYSLSNQYEVIDVKFNDPLLRHQIRRAVRYVGRKLRGQ